MLEELLLLMLSFSPIDSVKYRLIKDLPEKSSEIMQAFSDPRLKVYKGFIEKQKKRRKKYNSLTLDDYLRHKAFSMPGIFMGEIFIEVNRNDLERAEKEFGVDRYDIAAIIGIESFYGLHTGSYGAINSYLSYYFLTRNNYFYECLKNLFELGIDPFIKSSFSGAIGIPQFMAKSIKDFAIDFDGDGAINLFSFSDAIGSVANYLYKNGYSLDRHKAFRAYNNQDSYVKAVDLLSSMLRRWDLLDKTCLY